MSRALLALLLLGTGACRGPAQASQPPLATTRCPQAATTAKDPLAIVPAPAPTAGAPATTTPATNLGAPEQQRRLRGLAALDAGRFDLARQEFAAILEVAPANLGTQALFEVATRALLAAQDGAARSFADVAPHVLSAPPWRHTVSRAITVEGAMPAPKLVQLSAKTNGITDEAAWLQEHGFRLPEYEVPNPMRGEPGNLPPNIPPTFGKFLLVQAIAHPDHTILFYGPNYRAARFVAVLDARGRMLAFHDFDAYRMAPDNLKSDLQFVEQHAIWAEVHEGVLYISHGHNTYARSSRGMTAYITALDLGSGELRWRSDPLVAGASNFVIHGSHIFTGYGFTAEPDNVLVLDRRDGKVLSKARVDSAPEYLFLRDRQLFVRTYDTNHVFELR
jgi:hypothetical protein